MVWVFKVSSFFFFFMETLLKTVCEKGGLSLLVTLTVLFSPAVQLSSDCPGCSVT